MGAGNGRAATAVLPQNVDAEQSVLGGVILRNEVLARLDLRPQDFSDFKHRSVYTAICELGAAGIPIDETTLGAQLQQTGMLERVGGPAFVAQLALRCPTPDNTVHYGEIVRGLARKRQATLSLSSLVHRAGELEHDELADELERLRTELVGSHSGPRWVGREGIVRAIRERANEPWIELGLGLTTIAEVRAGNLVTLSGPTGRGKSTLAVAIGFRFAREQGWLFVLSLELGVDEMGGRGIGMQTESSWSEVLKGDLADDRMLEALPERLQMLDWQSASLGALDARLAELRAADPTVPVLFVIDYGQLLEGDEDEQRARVSAAWKRAKRIAMRHRAVGLMLSQMSRANARAANSGERVGAEAVDGGAETGAIEQWSSVVLELGLAGEPDQYGRRPVQLNVGKGRMGGGDMVWPLTWEERTGRFAVIGDAERGAEVKAKQRAHRDDGALKNALAAIRDVARRASSPQAQRELISSAGVRATIGRAACARLLESGELVEVEQRRPRSHSWLVWTPEQASGAGLRLVRDRRPDRVEGDHE